MKVSARESGAVGTAPRAVRNGAPLVLRWRHIAARSASAPYHLSHWVAMRLQYVANVEVLPVSNWPLANGIGYWQQWQHSSGPLPAILRDLLLLVPSLWLAVYARGTEMKKDKILLSERVTLLS